MTAFENVLDKHLHGNSTREERDWLLDQSLRSLNYYQCAIDKLRKKYGVE